MVPDVRSGTSVSDFAIVLDRVLYREHDAIFSLVTLEHGKVSAMARGAARSLKRFGAAVEAGNLVKAQLKAPKDYGAAQSPIWIFESADLKGRYDHFRKSYDAIESFSFLLRLVKDVFPDGPGEPALFKTLGRYLRDSERIDFSRNGRLFRICFWTWVGYYLGFGDLDRELRERIRDEIGEDFLQLWTFTVQTPDVDPKPLFTFWEDPNFPFKLKMSDEVRFYHAWLERSGMNWKHFEQWQNSQHF